ncbi:MAG: hypothetical protein EBT09_09835, partial [Actinobacteria bacterium]|nr:hypothetical protein [Actinomycetota bacterium]
RSVTTTRTMTPTWTTSPTRTATGAVAMSPTVTATRTPTPSPVAIGIGVPRTVAVRAVVPAGRTLHRGSFTITYPTQSIDVTSCSVTAANVTGTCTGGAGAWSVSINKVQGVVLTGAVSLVSIDIAVKEPGSYTITFASPAFLDDAGAAVTVGLDPITMVAVGTATATLTATPVPANLTRTATATATVPGGDVYRSLAAGSEHTCGLARDGTAYCWGSNWFGQLGDGTSAYGDVQRHSADRLVPVAVNGGRAYTALALGGTHTCALTRDGTAYCWGFNGNGQLGDGTSGNVRLVPVAVSGGRAYTALALGGTHTCALTRDGTAYCWGYNGNGQLGDGTSGVYPDTSPGERRVPVAVSGGRTFTALASGGHHTCGLTTDGTAYCWGQNAFGQLGDGTSGNGDVQNHSADRAVPVAVSGGRAYTALAAGDQHTCGLTNDWTAYCWGQNIFGQLGDGTVGTIRLVPMAVSGGQTYTALVASAYHTCGLATGGAAYCWGSNWKGELGDGTSGTARLVPVAVSGGRTYLGLASGGGHTCGLTIDGSAYCWGYNESGQLGDGTSGVNGDSSADRLVPVAVRPRV